MSLKKSKSYVTLLINSERDLKRITSILLILLLTFPAIKSFFIFTDFQLNRATIAAELCENIETDENCKGTCHLVKEIKKENPEKKKSPFTAGDNLKVELLYFENLSQHSFELFFINNKYFTGQQLDFDAHISAVFHPPKRAFTC